MCESMSRNYRSTSLSKKTSDQRHTLTPASSLSSVASSKSSDSTDSTCSSSNLNLSLFTSDSQVNKKTNQLTKHHPTKNSMVVNPVITHHPHHHHTSNHLLPNRLTRSTSTEQLNPLRFVAHNCLVKCMCLGQMSGEVFASVGNDNQIKLWTIGNTQSLVTLKGRTAIECVQFSRNEEVLATGSLKGSVQVYDLNSKNLIRTFRGHTSTIKSLDFFPSGDFLTSGSSDCTVKLWDIRKPDCVHTYDEHEKPITCQVFSPDGKWLASADSESIKVFDLTACKKIADLKAHTGAITDIKFHPMVLIMASSSVDGTICFWELEQFKLIGRISANTGHSSATSSGYLSSSCSSNRSSSIASNKTGNEKDSPNNAIHKILFHPNGYQLFATAKDKYLLCDAYNEPELNSVVNFNFGVGRDLASNKAGIIIGSHQQTYVSLQQIKWRDLDNYNFNRQNSANSTSSRRNFDQGQLHQTYLKLELLSSKYNDDLKSDPDDNDLLKEVQFKDMSPVNSLEDNNGCHVFSPKRELARTPPKENFFMDPGDDKTFLIENKSIEQFQKQLLNLKNKAQSINDQIKLPVIQNCVRPQQTNSNNHLTNSQQASNNNQTVPLNVSQSNHQSNYHTNHQTNHTNSKLNQTQTNHVNRMRSVPKSLSLRNLNKVSAVVQPVQSKQQLNTRTEYTNFGKITPAAVVYPDSHHPLGHNNHQYDNPKAYHLNTLSNGHPLGHNSLSISNLSSNLEPFKEINNQSNLNLMPSNVNLTLNSNQQGHSLSLSLGNLSRDAVLNLSTMDCSENQIMDELLAGHREMEQILNQREISLKFALNTWRNDTNKGFTYAHSTQDMTIVAELVKLTINKSEWNIQMCNSILPEVDNLLRSKQEGCVDAALVALEFIVENFLDLIKQNIAKHPSIGVDLQREERCKKSMDCYTQLVAMRAFINKQQCLVGQLGTQFRRLSSLMERIDAK